MANVFDTAYLDGFRIWGQGLVDLVEEDDESLLELLARSSGGGDYAYRGTPGKRRPSRIQSSTNFKRFGPRAHLDVSHEDNWTEDDVPAPPPVQEPQAPPRAPRADAKALPSNMPMLARPQAGPVSFQAQATPGQVANEFLATLDQLAREAGLDESMVAELQGIDAIDVSDVFNDMR